MITRIEIHETSSVACFLLFLVLQFSGYGQNRPDSTRAFQLRSGLPHFFEKLKKGRAVTIGYLGGSITEAPGYRVQTEKYFHEKYPNAANTAINAGGTGSLLGVF